MSGWMVLVSWGGPVCVGIVGVVVLALGWRGRRVGDGQFCAGCEFDLAGLGAAAACPECGRDLAADGGAVRGRRQRRLGGIVIGVLLILAATTVLLPVMLGARIAVASQPTGALIFQARWGVLSGGTAAGREEIAAELVFRRKNGGLTDEQLTELIEPALDALADRGVEWMNPWPRVSVWGELLGDAGVAGLLTAEQRGRCVQAAISGWQWHWSRRRLAGSDLSFQMPTPDLVRTVPGCKLVFVAEPTAATLDGQPLELATSQMLKVSQLNNGEPFCSISAITFEMPGTTFLTALSKEPVFVAPTSPLPPGEHAIDLEWRVRGWFAPSGNPAGRLWVQDLGAPDAVFDIAHTCRINVIEEPSQAISFVTDAADQPRFDFPPGEDAYVWRVSAVPGLGFDVSGSILNDTKWPPSADDSRVWVVARAWLRAGDDTGALLRRGSDEHPSYTVNQPSMSNCYLSGRYPFDERHEHLTLILAPDPDAAADEDRVRVLWNERIELPITLDWSGVPEDQLPPKPAAGR